RHRCAAERGADGAARRPYQVQGFNARNFSGKPSHEPYPPSSRPSPPVGEKVPGGRLRGIPTGSWPKLTSNFAPIIPLKKTPDHTQSSTRIQEKRCGLLPGSSLIVRLSALATALASTRNPF